jgi:N-glycosylase/DNA lyase
MQYGVVILGAMVVQIELPAAHDHVYPGVLWGSVDAFPSPAYWAYQVLARRVQGTRINFKLGDTLREEVGACLLGGHGIPARVGLAAFKKLKKNGAFVGKSPDEQTLFDLLSDFIELDGKNIRYRFARQKAKYLSAALTKLDQEVPSFDTGKQLRDWLLDISGVGLKTASWIARNWLDADDVAILDIHILRAGLLAGFFPRGLTVERDYLELESKFLAFSDGLGVRASELDAVIWWEMMSSGKTVNKLLGQINEADSTSPLSSSRRRTNNRNTNSADQLVLV